MLVRVEVRTRRGFLLVLPLEDASNGLAINEIEGLDPVKATLVSSSSAGVDGAQYHSAHREPRNLKFKISFEPDYIETSVDDLRTRLYSFFMPKTEVDLRFVMSDGLYVDITGRVEDFVSPRFTEEPVADISLLCFQPDFIDPNPVTVNDLLSTDQEDPATDYRIDYLGTVEVGVVLTIRPDKVVPEFTVHHRPPDGSHRQLDFSTPLSAGDKLVISGVTGAKGVTLTRNNSDSSVLYGLSPQSAWITFEEGDNYLRVYFDGEPIQYDIEYITRYGGL